jgi:hypothetical protein
VKEVEDFFAANELSPGISCCPLYFNANLLVREVLNKILGF